MEKMNKLQILTINFFFILCFVLFSVYETVQRENIIERLKHENGLELEKEREKWELKLDKVNSAWAEEKEKLEAELALRRKLMAELYIPEHEKLIGRPFEEKEVYLTSGFGLRDREVIGGEGFRTHQGVDLVACGYAPIVHAVESGVVIIHWPAPGTIGYRADGTTFEFKGHDIFGGFVIIQHDDGSMSKYGHLKKTFVREGMRISIGDKVGVMGETGIATGKHLHLEYWIGEGEKGSPDFILKNVDPLQYLPVLAVEKNGLVSWIE